MKQTAVQWLIQKLINRQNGIIDGFPVLSLDEIYDKAKQMEKEQHEDTWLNSRIESNDEDYIGKEKSFEQYYEQTYGGKP